MVAEEEIESGAETAAATVLDGAHALHLAAWEANGVVGVLVSAGATVDAVNHAGETALQIVKVLPSPGRRSVGNAAKEMNERDLPLLASRKPSSLVAECPQRM